MEEQDNIINVLKTTIKLVDNSSSSNIFRQSFINIFSIFDAYIFEYLILFALSKHSCLCSLNTVVCDVQTGVFRECKQK